MKHRTSDDAHFNNLVDLLDQYTDCLCDDHFEQVEVAFARYLRHKSWMWDFISENVEFLSSLMVNPFTPSELIDVLEQHMISDVAICLECLALRVDGHWETHNPEMVPFIERLRQKIAVEVGDSQ